MLDSKKQAIMWHSEHNEKTAILYFTMTYCLRVHLVQRRLRLHQNDKKVILKNLEIM